MDRRLVLRVLAGPNAGAEATLAPRTVIGSGEAADIVVGDPDATARKVALQLQGRGFQASSIHGAEPGLPIAFVRTDALADTSLRRTLIHLIGFKTSMRRTSQRIAGFHRMASNTERAADGVITS